MTSPLKPMYAKEDLLMSSADSFYLVSTLNGLVRQSKYSRANVYFQNVICIKHCMSNMAILIGFVIHNYLYVKWEYKNYHTQHIVINTGIFQNFNMLDVMSTHLFKTRIINFLSIKRG